MRIHFLGIAGTFMTGVALLARSRGHEVSGMDENIYPPMSDVLAEAGIALISDYAPEDLPSANIYVIGNVMRRGMPVVEKILNERLPYVSAPEWLAQHLLRQPNMQNVCAVAGTHGKTTTTSILAHLCCESGLEPGYLIGGKARNFSLPAAEGGGKLFVLEADEYDSAFFDKRSKFIHYRPDILIINNLEYDHGDIFPNMACLLREFRHLLRTVPEQGHIVYRHSDAYADEILGEECHAKRHRICRADELSSALAAAKEQGDAYLWSIAPDGSKWRAQQYRMDVGPKQQKPFIQYQFEWNLAGTHNADNLLAALASYSILTKTDPAKGISSFQGVERRLESLGFLGAEENNVELISDFAHHPTAIRASLEASKGERRVLALVVLASKSMRLGMHKQKLAAATDGADEVLWFAPRPLEWDPMILFATKGNKERDFYSDVNRLAAQVKQRVRQGDRVVMMSNASLTEILEAMRRTFR